MIRLALLRHGHTHWNREGRIQGRTDIPLDAEAKADLAGFSLPAPWDQADLVASPLQRAMQTAELVTGRPPRAEPALMEMDWGDWEGRKAIDLHNDPNSDFRGIETWGWHYTPPNGESLKAVRDRLHPWANGLTRDTLAVCHIGVMRVALAIATGWQFDGPAPFQVKRNRLFLITISKYGWQFDPTPLRLQRDAP